MTSKVIWIAIFTGLIEIIQSITSLFLIALVAAGL